MLLSTLFNSFCSETTGRTESTFIKSLYSIGDVRLYFWSRSHDPLAAIPIFGKHLKNVPRTAWPISLKLGVYSI